MNRPPLPEILQIIPADGWWAIYLLPKSYMQVQPIMAIGLFLEPDSNGDGNRMIDAIDDYSSPIGRATNLAGYYRSPEPPKQGLLDHARFIESAKVQIPDEWFAES